MVGGSEQPGTAVIQGASTKPGCPGRWGSGWVLGWSPADASHALACSFAGTEEQDEEGEEPKTGGCTMLPYYIRECVIACAHATVPYASKHPGMLCTLHWCSAPPCSPALRHTPSGWQLPDKPPYLLIKKHSWCSAVIKRVNYMPGDCLYLLAQEQACLECRLLRCRGDLGARGWFAMEIGGCNYWGGFPKMRPLPVSSGEVFPCKPPVPRGGV